ncbi:ABC transporter substrate-binding protein [Sansalvadorimonas sp. 2012CJ34-2]|uniref:ABC transporter substrate-binding protein n=1 Tax=Parendozoicomonas callyspongiae TaxID=2942213 RepID=A0ABT0PHM6_9GAMM|nr:ABC transporter substrate-binding protein [Sansalvadorimonas sp. 2012CJ34-2]MCL6270506.1 ABC transporter substrate-binding protein [Sansalvadorimonas sp. 2012CJ34-2]
MRGKSLPAMRTASLAMGLLASAIATASPSAQPGKLPEAPKFDAQGQIIHYSVSDLQKFEALPEYSEPEWVSKKVEAGELPPVSERLPKEPLVYLSKGMTDGLGEYGGVLRHVSGSRPKGWNWAAGLSQGWGGVSYAVAECLTRTGPLFTLNSDEQEPLPNLAKSWEWSEDGKQLTMNLIKGAKWSDGNPFDTEDIIFLWEDNIQDTNVPSRASPGTFGNGTTLKALDKYTLQWTFKDAFPMQNLFAMGFFNMCPGPSHILKPEHPRYNADATYDSYINAQKPDQVPAPTMGAWAPVYHKSDEMIVMRRNPYYWKVDEKGRQLPYIDEVRHKLSTWSDRTIQTVAGNADMSNMENPANYIESLRKSAQKNSPARLEFGPRTLGWSILTNFSKEYGTKGDVRAMEVRKLNRTLEFRQAVSHALDRQALAQSLVRGPFATPYAGGLYPEGMMGDKDSVVFYDYKPEVAKELLESLGLKDTDGDGIRNWTSGPMKGKNLDIVMTYTSKNPTDVTLAEGIISMMNEVGINLIPQVVKNSATRENIRDSGDYDFYIHRNEKEYIVPIQRADFLAPRHTNQPYWHRGTKNAPQKLLPFEQELVDVISRFTTETDPAKQAELMRQYNHIFTENVYSVGLVNVPGAMILNKRLKNVPKGTPILAYQWAEDATMRERFWVDKDLQKKQLFPEQLPHTVK